MNSYKTFLPCFPGFYESFLYSSAMETESKEEVIRELSESYEPEFPSELLYAFLKDNRLSEIDWGLPVDFEKYMDDAAKEFCVVVSEKLSKILGSKTDIQFEKIYSPREYNFTTDSVNCTISFNEKKTLLYCKNHYEAFSEYLKKNYTSYTGFIPKYSNCPEDWLNPKEWGVHEPGAILDFILKNEDPDAEKTFSEYVIENVWYTDYFRLHDSVDFFLKSAKAKEIADEYKRLMKQGDDYLDLMGGAYQKKVREGKQNVRKELVEEMEDAIRNL